MRLSNAVATGRTLIIPTRGVILMDPDHGCALGMGLAGAGVPYKKVEAMHSEAACVRAQWPWLTDWFHLPCSCQMGKSANTAFNIIGHVFDCHIMGRAPDWTLDQLIDWICSVEPAEPEEVANSKMEAKYDLQIDGNKSEGSGSRTADVQQCAVY